MGIDRVGFSPQLGLTMPDPQTGRQSLAEIPKIWEDFQRQVQKYYQAASGDTFVDRWGQSSGVWGTRLILGELADKHLPTNSLPFHKPVQRVLSPIAQNAVPYQNLLGIGINKIKVGDEQYFKTYRSLISREGAEAFKYSIKDNFRGFLKKESLKKTSLKDFWRKTFLGYNAQTISEPLGKGLFYNTLSRLAGFCLMGIDVLKKTLTAYQNSKDNGHSPLQTIINTGSVFLGQTLKAIVSWEIGTIGFAIGAAVLCIGTVPAILGGVLVGGLLGTACRSLMSLVVSDPPPQNNLPNANVMDG